MAPRAPASSTPIDVPPDLFGRTVGDAMLHAPKVVDHDTAVEELTTFFRDDHVHAAVVVDPTGRLVSVIDPADLLARDATEPAGSVGRLAGRTIGADTDLALTWWAMRTSGRRRLAVVDPKGRLLGLLCLKRSGQGFCGDADVESRRLERERNHAPGRRQCAS